MQQPTITPTATSRVNPSPTWDTVRAHEVATLRALANRLEAMPAPVTYELEHVTWMLQAVIRSLFIFKVGEILRPNTFLFRCSRERQA